MVATVTSTFPSGISGSGDTAAVSSILLPEMRRRGYDIDYSVAAVAGALGPIIPPSIIMVVLAMVCDLSVGAMFLGGEQCQAEAARFPDVIHPLVRTHPESGRRGLYMGGEWGSEIIGLPEAEGAALRRAARPHDPALFRP